MQLKLMVPTLATVVVSVIVSLYDALIIMKQLPCVSHVPWHRSQAQKVSCIVRTNVVALRQVCTLGDFRGALDTFTSLDSVPIVSAHAIAITTARRLQSKSF